MAEHTGPTISTSPRQRRQRRYLANYVPWWRSRRAAIYRTGFSDGIAYAKQRLGGRVYVDAPQRGRDY